MSIVTGPLVVVTGAARGFGRSLTTAARSLGASVLAIVRSHNPAPFDESVTTFVADCASADALDAIWTEVDEHLSRAPAIVLVNNAGYYIKEAFAAIDITNAQRTIKSNFLACVNVTRRMFSCPRLATVVNVISSSGFDYNVPRSDLRYKAMYGGSKRALSVLTEGLLDEAPAGLQFVNLYPRNINTWSTSVETDSMSAQELAEWVMSTAFRRPPWHLTKCLILPTE